LYSYRYDSEYAYIFIVGTSSSEGVKKAFEGMGRGWEVKRTAFSIHIKSLHKKLI